MRALMRTENIFIEPSACASFAAFLHPDEMEGYIRKRDSVTAWDRPPI